jgi:hypothetical protein
MAVTTFPNEKVLWSNKKYAIVEADVLGKRTVVVSDYWRTDYVHIYSDGKWAMDNPYWFPRYVLNRLYPIAKRKAKHVTEDYGEGDVDVYEDGIESADKYLGDFSEDKKR